MSNIIHIDFDSKKKIYLYFSIFLTTMALFIYETLLTRLFSTLLSPGLVFIVVSVAILGGGIGAIFTHKYINENNSEKLLLQASILMPVIFIAVVSIMYFLPYSLTRIIYIPASILPFITGGFITSIIFKEMANESNKLYLLDLLGAGLGSLLVINIINSFGFVRSVVITCIIVAISAISISIYYKKKNALIIPSIFLILMGTIIFSNSIIKNIENTFYSYYTNPGKLVASYEKAAGNAEIIFSKWDALSRTDVIKVDGRDDLLIATDGGAAAPIIKFNGDLNSVKYMRFDANYIPFSFGNNDKSLVIGSGGGNDILYALLGGNKKIDAVEINPSTIDAVNEFKEFSGDIYNYPGVNLYNQDGRYFIENSNDKYDNIYLSKVMTGSIENTMYSLAEYYIYTEEAIDQYLNHLTENGKLTFVAHNTFDLTKVVNTGIKALIDNGIKEEDVVNHFIIINGATRGQSNAHGSISMPVVIFKNAPFSSNEINSIITVAESQNRDIIQMPGYEIEPYKSLSDGKVNFEQLLNGFGHNANPTTDDKPFFYNYTKLFPLEMILILMVILTVAVSIKKKYINKLENKKASIYFAALGVAYMLVEIPLIQKTVLYFGSSSLAFSFIVFSLLISSGIGSLTSGAKPIENITKKLPHYILLSGVTILILQLKLNDILLSTINFSLIQKFLVMFIYVFPMGFFMGMAYPSGIKKVNSMGEQESVVPLMIAVNGIFSVFGSTLAVAISMLFGFSTTIYIGAAVYIILYFLNPLKS
ncbi:MAG: spermine synthase [Sedimentibacter sp.]